MYTSIDGLNHQANLTLCVDQESMTVLDSYYEVMNRSVGYVSHSFNQFVLVGQDGTIVTLDHGDAYPRAAVLMMYNTKAGNGTFSGRVSNVTVQAFPGQVRANATGTSLGGLSETNSGYVAAYNYIDFSSSTNKGRNVYIGYVPKESAQGTAVVRSVSPNENTSTPQLVSTGLNGGTGGRHPGGLGPGQ